jgi:hypothetical protein
MLNFVFGVYQLLVGLVVLGLTANYYYDGGAGFGYPIDLPVYYGVAIAVLLAPAFWAITHLCGGILMGFASGGFLDGVKLGLILGMGMALSKMWPYVLAAGAGVYLGGGPLLYTVCGAVGAVVLYALDWSLRYFWKTSKPLE